MKYFAGRLTPPTVVLCGIVATCLKYGAIPAVDVAFAALYLAYLAGLHFFKFGGQTYVSGALVPAPWLRPYAAFAGLLALLLPGAVMMISRSPAVVELLAPHMFLTVCQLIGEDSARPSHVMVRMLAPIGFNAWRLGTLYTWVCAAQAGGFGWPHVALAAANLAFWASNLFWLLLTVMLPKYVVESRAKLA